MRSVNRIFIILLTVLTYCSAAVAQSSGDVIIRYVDAQKGSYANPGTSWATATKSLQGAINELYAILQKDPTKTGRVYVMGQYVDDNGDPEPGSGTYTPTESVEQVSTGVLDTSFKLYAGISIYGSFSPKDISNSIFQEDGSLRKDNVTYAPESDGYLKALRPTATSSNYQWTFQYPSTLSGNHAANADEDPLVWNENNDQYDQSFPGNSYHVLWFATNGYIDNAKHPNRARGLDRESVVDGFVIRDGNALNKSNTDHKHNSYGGGAYMVHKAVVRRCVFTQNAASLRGGAVYMDGGGLVEQCYFNRNQAAGVGITDGYGGAVCIDGDGAVKHSVMDNNAARVGGGLMIGSYDADSYPAKDNTYDDAGKVTASADTRVSQLNYYHPYAAGCIINNNTTTAEGGGVMLKGGTLNHCTITNNNCVGVDVTYNGRRYGRSGGLYVDGGGLAVNTVCWGNQVKNNKDVQYAAYTINSTAQQKPILAYCAFSNTALTDWSGTTKRSVLTLSTSNEPSASSTDNEYFPCFKKLTVKQGVIAADKTGTYYASDPFMPIEQDWEPEGYSYLRAQGIQLNDYPGNTNIVQAHIAEDLFGRDYTAKTTLGALVTNDRKIEPATDVERVRTEPADENIDATILTLFVDPAKGHTVATTGYGNNWENPLSSINDALTQLAKWQNADGTFTYNGTKYQRAQILVKEGELNCSGSAVYGQLRSSTINMLTNVRLYGGFPSKLKGTETSNGSLVRNPVAYPTRITAEVSADGYEHNACHIINFSNVTNAVVDGFQLYYANANDDSNVFKVHNKNGAGVICGNTNTTAGSEVEMDNRIRNCVIANCTAEQGSAIYVKSRNKSVLLHVENCVIHNNEAKGTDGATVYVCTDKTNRANTTLNMNHCTIRGNVGYAISNANATVNLNNSAIHANASTALTAITQCTDDNVRVLGINGSLSATSSNNNMQDGKLPTTAGVESKFTYSSTNNTNYTYPKFVNPTRNIGVNREGDLTVYGGSPNWMPGNMNPMVNAASDTGASATDALWGKDMTTVIFRNYGGAADIGALENYDLNNSKYQPAYGKVIYVRDYRDANGNVDTSKGGDGSSWAKAINGNCPTYTNDHGFDGYDAELYAEDAGLTGLQWAVDEAYYRSLNKNASNKIIYTTKSGVYRSTDTKSYSSSTIKVSEVLSDNRVQVWVAKGEYLRRDGFFMRDGVDVYAGFPDEGNPGMNERHPKQYETAIETNTDQEIADNQFSWGDILHDAKRNSSPVSQGYIQQYNYDLNCYIHAYRAKRVLTQPFPYYVGTKIAGNRGEAGNMEYDNNPVNPFLFETKWDGFTIKNGRTRINHQRDGAAGVSIRNNGILENCVVKNNINRAYYNTRGGGIFCNGGTIVNCKVSENQLLNPGKYTTGDTDLFGGGLYLRMGTVYNSVFAHNKVQFEGSPNRYDRFVDGSGVFFENGKFYNNTITGNDGNTALKTGDWFLNGRLYMYNSIVYGNTNKNSNGYEFDMEGSNATLKNCFFESSSKYPSGIDGSTFQIGNPLLNDDYTVKSTSKAINTGLNEPDGVVLPTFDAAYNDRIQDCTVDIGAYEYNGAYDITPDLTSVKGQAIYYVTQNGRGNASASSPANAACATKLQKVLDAAGRYIKDHSTNLPDKIIVKLAGDYDKTGFKYTPLNSTVDDDANATGEEVASTYSIIVPRGVELWGGYTDDYKSADENGFYTKTTEGTTTTYTDNRDVMKHHTVLSGKFVKDELTVNAYHVVTFTDRVYNGEHKPMTATKGGYLSLKDYAGNRKAVVDGVFIEGGMAVGESNSATKDIDRYGGAAVVTNFAHVRNCIIRNNTALNGGGALCLQPGALVSGCLIELNAATGNDGKGGGIYVQPSTSTSNGGTTFDITKARVLTSTIVNNWAQNDGGGIYFGNDAPNLRANSVVLWQNDSNGELNVSGLLDPFSQTDKTGAVEDYPLSYCAVELLRVPGINNIDVSNIMEQGVRFNDYTQGAAYNNDQWTDPDHLGYYDISDYSTLARAGMSYTEYDTMRETFTSLEERDFAGICRMEETNGEDEKINEGDILNKDNEYIEIGARAYNGRLKLEVKEGLIMHRIYVSKQEVDMDYITKLKTLTDNVYALQGSSQAYPMHRLDDALEYVREVRKKTKTVNSVTSYTHNNEYFEIFLTKGEYTPLRTAAGQKTNSRGNTFLVPEGVAIYGGLDTESDVKKGAFYGQIEDKSTETNDDIPATKDSNGDPTGMPTIETTATTAILEARQHYDMNKNSIIEPWEFKNQSQLSGNVVNNNVKQNVFHVVTILADEDYVGGLPTLKADGKTALGTNSGYEIVKTYKDKGAKVVLDGVEIRDGRALNYEEAAEDTHTFYRGGGIMVLGNWTTGHQFKHGSEDNPRAVGYRNIPLEVRNCQFVDNGARLGGAIYSDSEVSIVQSSFVQNFAEGKTETFTDNTDPNNPTTKISYSGRGGALNLSYEASIVNTIFANNEARRASADASEDMGWGGAVSMGDYAALNMLNCDVVRNKAVAYPAVYLFNANQGGDVTTDAPATLKANNPTKIVNTVFWGNVTENASQTAERQMVVNYRTDAPSDTPSSSGSSGTSGTSGTSEAETLWFCAYEQDKGLTPEVLSTDVVDLRRVEYEKDTYIPYAWKSLEKTKGSTIDAHDKTNNIIISSQNEVTGGPNFIKPSTIAGCDGYDVSADWMIGRINNLVDNGWTYLQQNSTKTGYDKYSGTGESESIDKDNGDHYKGSGIYYTVTYKILGDDLLPIGEDQYMSYANAPEGSSANDQRIKRISNDPNPTHEQSYIDIGVYEYQHQVLEPAEVGDLDLLWVTDQEQSGVKANGKTFATASSDLQRAIETLLSYRNGHRKEIRLLAGEYQPVYTLNGNLGFTIDTEHVNVSAINGTQGKYQGVASLTIQGGWSKEVKGQYNVDEYPAYIYSSQRTGVKDENLAHVFVINNAQQIETFTPTSGEKTHKYTDHVVPITLEGIVFCNVIGKVHNDFTYNTKQCRGGAAVYYKDQYDVELKSGEDRTNTNVQMDANGKAKRSTTTLLKAPGTGESNWDALKNHCPSNLLDNKLTIRQCGFRFNGMKAKIDDETPLSAVSIGKGGGQSLIYNSVFHTNGGDALVATGTKVLNCTFAQNYGNVKFYDHTNNPSELHNSLLWRNDLASAKDSRNSVMWSSTLTSIPTAADDWSTSSGWTNDKEMAAKGLYDVNSNSTGQSYFTYNAATTLPNTYETKEIKNYIDGTSDTGYNMYLSETNDDVINGPNFFNPMENVDDLVMSNLWILSDCDYNVHPGVKTVGKANPYLYINKVYGATADDIEITVTHENKTTVKVETTGSDNSGRGANESVKTYLQYVNVHKDNTEVSGTMTPSDLTNATLRADKNDYADKDKGYYDRYYGTKGMELGAYECIASIKQVMYYDPHQGNGDGSSWEKAYGKGQLNTALMAAAVAASGGNEAYVFAHGTNTSVQTNEYITMYDGVHLIGGLKQTFKKQHDDKKTVEETITNVYPTTEAFIKTAIYERQAVAGDEANPTIINGVTLAPNCKQAEIDGVVISNEDVTGDLTSPVVNLSQGSGLVIRNSIIRNNTMGAVDNTAVPLISQPTGSNYALMYNVLVRDNTPGTSTGNNTGTTQAKGLYMVNCTVADATIDEEVDLEAGHGFNNLFSVAPTPFAPYFNPSKVPYTLPKKSYSKDLWYQLVEGSTQINKGNNNLSSDVFGEGGIFNGIIDYAKDLDLLGNPRQIGAKVDNGCYETWNASSTEDLSATTEGGVDISADPVTITNYGGNKYPHAGSVVYLDGGAMVLAKKSDDSFYFNAGNPMTAGYLLVKNGGSLYGQGNHVSLDYVAVERKDQGQYALVSLPFNLNIGNDGTYFTNITSSYTPTGSTVFPPVAKGKGLYAYSGEKRAEWGYNFKESYSTCWKELDYTAVRTANEGFLFDRGNEAAAAVAAVRYTATGTDTATGTAVYTEGGEAKKVTLQQYDTRTTTNGSAHFTRKEDMGWNLKGLPYLISSYHTNDMGDGTYRMNVPHVIYDMDATGNYGTKQSWTGGPTLTVGDGFFTQTAKIVDATNNGSDFEQLTFNYCDGSSSGGSTNPAPLLELTDGEGWSDCMEVRPQEQGGSLVYNLGSDGVKMVSPVAAMPQVYALGAQGVAMSLVANAPAETDIALGVRTMQQGAYTFALPETLPFEEFGHVWLMDKEARQVTDLMTGSYTASIEGEGYNEQRFVLRIGGLMPDLDGCSSSSANSYLISVRGTTVTVANLQGGEHIYVYTPVGALVSHTVAEQEQHQMSLPQGVYVVKVNGMAKKVKCY